MPACELRLPTWVQQHAPPGDSPRLPPPLPPTAGQLPHAKVRHYRDPELPHLGLHFPKLVELEVEYSMLSHAMRAAPAAAHQAGAADAACGALQGLRRVPRSPPAAHGMWASPITNAQDAEAGMHAGLLLRARVS